MHYTYIVAKAYQVSASEIAVDFDKKKLIWERDPVSSSHTPKQIIGIILFKS